MSLRPARLMALALVAVAALGGCGGGDSDGEVIASFYPLKFVAERVVGEHADVGNLTAPGVEPHDVELSPRQVASIAGAEVVLYQRGFQPAVDEAVDNDGPEHVLDVTEAVDLRTVDGSTDPHFWLDPTRLAEAAAAFAEQMAAADPDHAAAFESASAELRRDLTALDAEFRDGLRDCRTRTVVVSHDAFGYLGARYDLELHAIAGLSPDAEPSARHLGELADLVRAEGVTTVFTERLASPRLAETLADDVGVGTAVLDPVEGPAEPDSDEDYFTLMRANLDALRKAGACR